MLRPTFTENLLQDLLRGKSINVYGAIGQGQARLLEDLVPLAKENALLVLRVNMKSFARNYNLMISNLNAQLCALFPDKTISCTNFSEVMNTLDEHAKTAKVLLMLENFDAVLDKPNPPEFADFFNDLNRLRNQQHRLLLALTQKPYDKKPFVVGKITQITSILDLTVRHMDVLSLQECEDELKRSLKTLPNSRDLNKLKNSIHANPRAADFLVHCYDHFNAKANQDINLDERLKIWEEEFDDSIKTTLERRMHYGVDRLDTWVKKAQYFLGRFKSIYISISVIGGILWFYFDKIKQFITGLWK